MHASPRPSCILFLDADDELDDDFIASAVDEFEQRGLGVATTLVDPIERDPRNVFACEVVNMYLDVMQYVSPHAPGFCILVRREVHEAIGGFDETVVLAEDHDYVQRAAEQATFRVLHDCMVRTSMRRIEKEGLVRLAFKYLYCELYVVTGRPIREVPFDYEFAAFEPGERPGLRADLEGLAQRLGEVADAAFATSADGFAGLRRLGSRETEPLIFDETLRLLNAREVARRTSLCRCTRPPRPSRTAPGDHRAAGVRCGGLAWVERRRLTRIIGGREGVCW